MPTNEDEGFEVDREALGRINLSLGGGRRYELEGPTGRRGLPLLAIVLLLALAGAAVYFVLGRRARPEPAASPPLAGERDPAAPSAAPSADTRPLPALGVSDEFVRELVGRLSRHPQLVAWLASDDLVRRFVGGVASFAAGRSPGEHVPFLRPAEPFAVGREGDRRILDPAGYDRYDPLAAVVTSLDTAGTAELYRRLEPLFDEAYRELGFPDGRFRDVAEPALGRLLAASPVEGPIELVAAQVGYAYADPRLEGLDAASRHLLRLGPENLAAIQAKAAAIAAAAGLTPSR